MTPLVVKVISGRGGEYVQNFNPTPSLMVLIIEMLLIKEKNWGFLSILFNLVGRYFRAEGAANPNFRKSASV